MSCELVHALEVGRLRLVPCLDERLVARLDEGGDTAAEDGLLAKEVGLGLLFEGRGEYARSCAADAPCVGEADVAGGAGGVLVDGQQSGHPGARA